MTARVGLVLVSHSEEVARGTARLAAQMAPDVTLEPAGGVGEDGSEIGTSADRVQAAVERALGTCEGVVVLTDLGSAVLTAEMVLELLDEDAAARVRVPHAPFVEGAVAAAVAAQQGGDVAAVVAAAHAAGADLAQDDAAADAASGAAPGPAPAGGADVDGVVSRTVTVRNPLGLHARPAAVVARTVSDLGIPVTIDGADGASVLALMRLGSTQGRTLEVSAHGEGAEQAVDAVVALIDGGFGEA